MDIYNSLHSEVNPTQDAHYSQLNWANTNRNDAVYVTSVDWKLAVVVAESQLQEYYL